MPGLAELIYVWGMAAAVIAIPTGLFALWALSRTASWNVTASQTPQAEDAAIDVGSGRLEKAA